MKILFNDPIAAGERSTQRQHACYKSGGHYKDRETTVNGKPAWGCRCGMAAPKTARIWTKVKP